MVGNRMFFFIFTIFFYTIHLSSSVQLSVYGDTQYEAVIGEQFVVDLIIRGIQKGFPEPVLQELPHASIQRAGLYMSTINGKSEIRYSYQVSFDEIGTYVLGPVTIKQSAGSIDSNTISIKVSHGKKAIENSKQEIFLRLTTDLDEVVVGQPILCTLSCYVKRRGISISQVTPPRITRAQLKSEKKSEESQEIIDGEQYAVIRFAWEIVPSEIGEFVIPAAAIEYTAQSKNRGSFLFSLFADEKRIYSNACVVNVSPLPVYDSQVHAIGKFGDFSASISPTIIKQGEATTIRVTVRGSGTFVSESPYDLQDIPDAIRHYPVEPKKNNDLYTFEYVVQGISVGVYTIPEQTFTFFNTETKQYEQLHTTSLELHINENPLFLSTKISEIDNAVEELGFHDSDLSNDKNQDGIVHGENNWLNEYEVRILFPEGKMSWFFFLFFLFFILFVKLLFIAYTRFLLFQVFVYRILFKCHVIIAMFKMYRLEQKVDIKGVRELFVSLIAYFYKCSKNDAYLFLSDLNDRLKQVSKKDESFTAFWHLLDRTVYYKYSTKEKLEIFQQSWFWCRQFLFLKLI